MCKTVFEFSWRITQQLIIFDQDEKDMSKIKGWGSGFFLGYKDRLFLVTADHCVHYDDYKEGRLGRDDKVCVVNNIYDKKQWRSTLTPFGGFFYFDKYDIRDMGFPDLQDFAFAMHENKFEAPFLTRELKAGDTVFCEDAKEKFILKSEAVVDFNKDRYYVCTGTVMNEIKNGMFNACANALHCDLRFREYDSDGNAVLDYSGSVKYKEWAGLSGGPVMDDQCHVAGMLIRVSEPANTITAVPMKKIMRLMDAAIQFEEMNKAKSFGGEA